MLKALELVGFKSFADKTRFEFPPGITVVVGPNGSGKSNIVDAVKWVLGEQSVKSLRGREMADVIFNGSGSRRAVNSAEITLTLDNSQGRLAIDTPEVHITRRVYRSGEGEYLLNRQPCRLRDIRDLLAGTGMATDAYSIIEQGKVDVLLQSSARDRRLIFEEAAGISRFKAKKIEALRRLERVEQNLLRLSDIVEEVDNRLRILRAQAGKARRYREYTDRLQELRTQVGLVDWRRLSDRLAILEGECRGFADQRDSAAAAAETAEVQLSELDRAAAEIGEVLRDAEAQIAANRERIAATESAIDHERGRLGDLEEEITRHRRQLLDMSSRAGDVQQQVTDTHEAVETARSLHRTIGRDLGEIERQLTAALGGLDQSRAEDQQLRESIIERMRIVAALGNEIGVAESHVATAAEARGRAERQVAEIDAQTAVLDVQWTELRSQQQELAAATRLRENELAQARAALAQTQQQLVGLVTELTQWRQRQTGLAERAALLQELEHRQEGLGAGVKAVLAQARSTDGPFASVAGLVADLVVASVEDAPLVEAILGQTAQHVVARRDPALVEHLRLHGSQLPGRVGFVWLDEPGPTISTSAQSASEAQPPGDLKPEPRIPILDGLPGVVGRASRLVETQPAFASLGRRLLGHAWIVESLQRAIELHAHAPAVMLVTPTGEQLLPDGTLVVGPRDSGVGLISRRSQLRALRGQLREIEAQIATGEASIHRLEEQANVQEKALARAETAEHHAREAFAEQRYKVATAQRERRRLDEQRTILAAELETAARQWQSSQESLAAARVRQQEAETDLAGLQSRLAELQGRAEELEVRQRDLARQATEKKVDLAKSEERLRNLRSRLQQFQENQSERQRAIGEGRAQLAEALQRQRQSQGNVLRAESEIANLYLSKETFGVRVRQWIGRRSELQLQRTMLTAEAQRVRAGVRKAEEKIHAKELEANEVRLERGNLVARLRDDYGIDLEGLQREPSPGENPQRAEVQQEIDDLRRKIAGLGNVNLEALEELDQLEERYRSMSGQYQDLSSAKTAIEKIIDKINGDSRRLFADTLAAVKEHFQTLFRDLFGGGRADIILEEGVDLLESGIEIVARPPGKEPRNISLLSGGEKTLTCVALLLAIFRSRPSPFCVLDEVDAALDEANIDRFTKVLQDFLAWTQFIIVTHSKKTMTCASTLYGVTMQESGISKQVSVRFDDVHENGEIRSDRLHAEALPPPAANADEEIQAA